jgi:hypothetical protein
MATMGKITHKKTRVMPSADEPINSFFIHNGYATIRSQVILYIISNITIGNIIRGRKTPIMDIKEYEPHIHQAAAFTLSQEPV